MKVLVTHPGRQHSHQAALALVKAELLAGYWAGAPSLAEHGRWLPPSLWRRFVRYAPVALPARLVRWHPTTPLLRRLGDAVLPTTLNPRLDYFACREFDRWAARGLRRVDAGAVVACEISALSTFEVARARGARCFLDAPSIHHQAQDRLHGFTESPALHRRITAIKDREIERADAILTVSELARSTYLEAGVDGAKVHAVTLGADLALFGGDAAPRGLAEPPRFLFSGAMIRRKGFDLLLTAFAEVRRHCPKAELVLAGPRGDASPSLELHGRQGIVELGTVTQRELAARLATVDCLVLPSRNDSYGMVVAEALAAGVPVIVSSMVGSKDLVREGETGWIVPLEDVATLTQHMLFVANHREQVRTMRSACQRAAEGATWESYHRRFAALIRELVAPGPDRLSR